MIKQPNCWSCMACVAAMITGEMLQDVINFLGHDGSDYEATSKHPLKYHGFTWDEIMRYLLNRGYSVGFYLKAAGDGYVQLNDDDNVINVDVGLNVPAIVSVKSMWAPGHCGHVVYWNGQQVLDPNPDISGLKLGDYEIEQWWPIIEHSDWLFERE